MLLHALYACLKGDAMNVIVNDTALLLDRAETVELVDAAGAVATLSSGCLWITMDGDPRDIVLCAGDHWQVERNGRTLVHAQVPSTLRITGPKKASPASTIREQARRFRAA